VPQAAYSKTFVFAHFTYRYNGLGHRIMWQYDDDGDQTLESQETFHFMYDERWRIVGTFRNADTDAKESFVYHAAGKAGRGDASYIDNVILRDRDTTNGWTGNPDGSLDERRYYCQNWRADVVALTKRDGQPVEFIRYSSYDRAQAFAAADVNRDGVVNSTDAADWDNLYTEASSNAAIPVDFDFDGAAFDPADNDAFYAAYSEASGWSNGSGGGSLGGRLSRIGNRKGYAGYEFDMSVEAYHVRHRVYIPELGRWTKRDPLGYVDGLSLYEYCSSSAISHRDTFGLNDDICNPADAPGDILVCRNDDDGPNKDVPKCVWVSPNKCASKVGGAGDWEYVWIPSGPHKGWHYCDSDLEDCDPDWWEDDGDMDELDPMGERTPYRRFQPIDKHTDYLHGICAAHCKGNTTGCGDWTTCMNSCLDNRNTGDPLGDPGICPHQQQGSISWNKYVASF